MTQDVAVMGATGRQGGAVAARLVRAGWTVKAVTRNPAGEAAAALLLGGASVVQADLNNVASLQQAFEGCTGVFGVTDYWEHGHATELQHGLNMIEAARRAGVGHFVFSSVGATERIENLGITHFEGKREIERHLESSGLSSTVLRPVTFFENFLSPRYRQTIARGGTLRFGFVPGKTFQMVSMPDLAEFAFLAFGGDPRVQGKATEIASDRFTMEELVEEIGRAAGKRLNYAPVGPVAMRLIALFIQATGRQGHYKAGPPLINQFNWNNRSDVGGWNADLDALRAIHPQLMTMPQWARSIDWQAAS